MLQLVNALVLQQRLPQEADLIYVFWKPSCILAEYQTVCVCRVCVVLNCVTTMLPSGHSQSL